MNTLFDEFKLLLFAALIVYGIPSLIYLLWDKIFSSKRNRIEKKYHIQSMKNEISTLSSQVATLSQKLYDSKQLHENIVQAMNHKHSEEISSIHTEYQTKLANQTKEHESIVQAKNQEQSEVFSRLHAEYRTELANQMEKTSEELLHYKTLHEKRERALEQILTSNLVAFPFLAGVISDYMTYDLEILAQHLDWGEDKKRLKKVADIREIRKDAQQRISESRLAYYQLEYLKQLFPSVEEYIETDYNELPSDLSVDRLLEHDYRKDYLSKEEWTSLSEIEKNQLVLDRYIESHNKTKWQIGRDYELYVGYTYLSQGYDVDYFGTLQKLEEMGRDMIVKKDGKTAIVQCKYWSTSKLIHEKHIAQLYGTTISYCIENNLPFDSVNAVLVTNTVLSDVAKQMAEHLNVRYRENFELGNFPRIKCNIGKDESGIPTKIYHLPMDQQYDSVRLVHSGEFLAFTVEEAENAGFRHAYRWHGN